MSLALVDSVGRVGLMERFVDFLDAPSARGDANGIHSKSF